ncbi:thiol-disulfide oxidoreductase DCC family protein [Marinibactrum halimedae]|uniref:Thiol-disulfide oxidoreductase n=1 Tax=Marinibactrum halimedae TaxID=1444977 RepID=A0AA37T6S7_9GAMM|nr:DUF393 domain-containing protein [Marinibactrum halimedae]MCD9460369.1 DUF393 domain-containing protein [Marinibactrum halimedae]GLS26806.1 thiol-disulfide oxidoreductase [Marinibactrum halimedae]
MTTPKIRVFYNSACPVCDAGISAQKKKSTVCGIEWEDVHLDNEKAKHLNADLEFVRERLHVIDTYGNLRVGYEAFIAIWENSPREQWKAKISKIPGLRWVLNKTYNIFAKLLYVWNRTLKHW